MNTADPVQCEGLYLSSLILTLPSLLLRLPGYSHMRNP